MTLLELGNWSLVWFFVSETAHSVKPFFVAPWKYRREIGWKIRLGQLAICRTGQE